MVKSTVDSTQEGVAEARKRDANLSKEFSWLQCHDLAER
jgi:hypothetical protein